jgi:molybdate transport system substrate-binding protein
VARLTIRVDLTGHGSFGPGKIKLLELAGESGSISTAGRAMGLSYRRAWTLVDALNRAFRSRAAVRRGRRASRGGGCMRSRRTIVAALGIVLLAATGVRAQEVTLSVAISLKDVTEQLGRVFTGAHPGVTLRYNFGGSGSLQKQIEAGAPIDVFLSAGQRQMDELERQRLIVGATRRAFARNVLTVIEPADSRVDIAKPADLLEARVTRIVIGNPRTVPAGQYAEESLRALGLWERLQPKLVFSENVRQALDYVARGEVDAGFVYTTDAATRARSVREAFRPPDDSYRPIVYPGAVVAGTRQPALARAFLDLLAGPQGRAVLGRLGFQPPPPGTH